MSRIMIAVSSPWAAQKAVEPVADLAKRLGAEVLVVHVSRPSGGQMREQEQADGESPSTCSARPCPIKALPFRPC